MKAGKGSSFLGGKKRGFLGGLQREKKKSGPRVKILGDFQF